MGNCWSCGAPVSGLRYVFTCPACTETAVMKEIRKGIRDGVDCQESAMRMIASGLSQVADEMSGVADGLSTLAAIVQGGFDELNWELQQQTQVLLSIDQTLKSPSQTQAREWREMAEQLRSRCCFDEAEQWFKKSLEMSPLDYRTYVGLAMNYLRKNDFDKAEAILLKSLPHAPQTTNADTRQHESKSAEQIAQEFFEQRGEYPTWDPLRRGVILKSDLASPVWLARHLADAPKSNTRSQFDYKSLSHRLIGRIWACRGDYERATAELRLAIELSPDYPEGNYDYALYLVQSERTNGLVEPLRRAISSRPGYFNVIMAEPRFAPVAQDLTNLLSGLLNEAYRNASQEIGDAETMFAKAQRVEANAWHAELVPRVKEIATLLATARSDLASNDYVRLLKLSADATRAATLSCALAQDAGRLSIVFSQEKKWWHFWK